MDSDTEKLGDSGSESAYELVDLETCKLKDMFLLTPISTCHTQFTNTSS